MSIILPPSLFLEQTDGFSVISLVDMEIARQNKLSKHNVIINWECSYTRSIITAAIQRRRNCRLISRVDASNSDCKYLQLADFENIEWESVLSNKSAASSFLVRKGLSRKAQMSLQIKKYLAKHPKSILKQAIPYTLVIETWNAFEDDMKLDLGGGFYANFDLPEMRRAPFRQRLDWILADTKQAMEDYSSCQQQQTDNNNDPTNNNMMTWILKPSVANKGADISIITEWDDLLDALEATEDMREWVLQAYIDRPLLISGGYKFHLRVYVLAIGALNIFVFDEILMLLAAKKYDLSKPQDILRHLTNTARAVEDDSFQEEKFVKLLSDLPAILYQEYHRRYPSLPAAQEAVRKIHQQIHGITSELFAAYENEYSIFCPMTHCCELYGLDFLVDEQTMQVSLLEANPGPDFKQTGDRLQGIIVQLWEQTMRLVIDMDMLSREGDNDEEEVTESKKKMEDNEWLKRLAPDFTLVYSKEWSVANMKGGGMKLKD